MDYFALGAVWYVVFIISVTFHEACHGLAAKKLGDPTAYHHGLVTTDPLPHIKRSPFGMVVMPMLSFLLFGWMIGWASAPVDPYWVQNNRREAALTSLAGPAANLILVFMAALIIHSGMHFGFFRAPEAVTFTHITETETSGLANSAAVMVSILFSLNLLLMVFNLIPLPPLDGSNVLSFFLSARAAENYENFLSQPMHRIFGLIIAWQIFGYIFSPILSLALSILYPGT